MHSNKYKSTVYNNTHSLFVHQNCLGDRSHELWPRYAPESSWLYYVVVLGARAC